MKEYCDKKIVNGVVHGLNDRRGYLQEVGNGLGRDEEGWKLVKMVAQ